jgi:hypothetical protein
MTSSKVLASGKWGTASVPRPSSVRMNTGSGAPAAKVVLPTPCTPWIRTRGGFSAVVRFREAREMAMLSPSRIVVCSGGRQRVLVGERCRSCGPGGLPSLDREVAEVERALRRWTRSTRLSSAACHAASATLA